MFKRFILRLFYKVVGMNPAKMPMVKYWKSMDHVSAKLTVKDGSTQMVLDGEKHPMWGFPRGHLLIPQGGAYRGDGISLEDRIEKFGPFSVIKHELKNQVFNETWRKLEEGLPREKVVTEMKQALKEVCRLVELLKYDLMPPKTMCPAVREIHRALTKVGCPSDLRDVLTLILQEDDSFRYRVQWLAVWIPLVRWNPVKIFEKGLKMIEEAEVVGDMKRRIRLLRRVLSLGLEDKRIREMFTKFFKEVSWRKVRITEADRYHFRGKYFKVDMDVLEY